MTYYRAVQGTPCNSAQAAEEARDRLADNVIIVVNVIVIIVVIVVVITVDIVIIVLGARNPVFGVPNIVKNKRTKNISKNVVSGA